ncbi:MAG: GNAT family N-acetyltransferase [Bryobacteraceae bacterium]
MAALPERGAPGLVDLHNITAGQLDGILEEEIIVWRERMNWDFRPSADLVRRFVRMHSLSGYALIAGDRVAGYSYFVCEENKGLIGDLFVTRSLATIENEHLLLGATLEVLAGTPFVHRVECQLMMLTSSLQRILPLPHQVTIHKRKFMTLDAAGIAALGPGKGAGRVQFEMWTEGCQDDASRLIARAYSGHIDSQINDQYRTPAGARRFLGNIIQYPGCGSFFAPASVIALDPRGGGLIGVCLSSLVSPEVGHITQVCVDPPVRGAGAGYELLRQSLLALARHGCGAVSLTVTAANTAAVDLYDRMGFHTMREFGAYVWEGL